ncbi:MAG: hypothetical protein KAY65_12860 [Planctomycetes bacterium]|nr:hypothetical protein [Planctomycetota bacterium]
MIWEKSRRIGATYADSYKACRDRNLCDERRDLWFSSADESAALEYALYCRQWCELMEIVIKETTEELEDEKGYKYNNYVIEFPNGSRANCLTSNPRRFRSKGGDVVLDEFAWHDQAGEMLDAALPTTTWGYTIRILSTHNGEGSVFNKIVELCKRVARGELTDWGDDWWINMGRVPARFTLEAGLEGLTGPSLPEGEPQGEEQPKAASNSDIRDTTYEIRATSDEARRLRIWRNWVISWSGIEKEYQNALRTFFVRQQRILTKKLRDALAESENLRASKAPSDDVICRIVFDLKIEDGKIKVINQTFFGKASELGIRQSLSEVLGLKGDELAGLTEQVKVRPRLKRSLLISSRKITGVNRTTQDMVANQLRTGLEAGEGLKELTARLKSTLGSNRARA